MLINQFQPEWKSVLNRLHSALPQGASLILLIDSAFVPGIFRKLSSACKPILLFELLPGCSEDARDISPFVLLFNPMDRTLLHLLTRCSGWPMLSVLTTYESVEQLARRLAAWCIVEAGGQSFNFRFSDTRRLPAVLEALKQQQRSEFIGNAISWHYVSREGSWRSMPLESNPGTRSTSQQATLDERQFAKLLEDSEADEMWVQLLDRGARTDLLPAQRYALLSNALRVADTDRLDDMLKILWCNDCIQASGQIDTDTLRARLKTWKQENAEGENENLCWTA